MKCLFCDHETDCLSNLKRHVVNHHLDGFSCPVCGKKTKKLLTHLRWANDEKHQALYAVLSSGKHTSASSEARKRVKVLRDKLLMEV